MAHSEQPPFDRGSTFVNGAYTIDANNLPGANLEGTVWEFPDLDLSVANTKKTRSNRIVKCMVVRNTSGIALLPKRMVNLKASGLNFLGQVDGYTTTTAAPGYPIDEWLPPAGVPNNDLFYIVIDGPATVLTDIAAAAGNLFSAGSILVALTGVTSQSTTAGRVAVQDLTGATALLGNQVQNRIGAALSASTTNNTAADRLMDVRKW